MAGLAHLGVGLAAKRAAPTVPVGVLIAAAYGIDIVFGVFWLAGVERIPGPGVQTDNPWSHGLFMAVVWSLSAGLVGARVSRSGRTGVVLGLVVLSHWIVDFVSHPMTAVFPADRGLPLLFEGSRLVGLGLWKSPLGVNIGEYGTTAVGLGIYVMTLLWLRRKRRAAAAPNPAMASPAAK
jgi:hypothetical protein